MEESNAGEGRNSSETRPNGETITDIQNYLDSFNQQIEEVNEQTNDDGATYYVDSSGQYYYRSKSNSCQVMTVVRGLSAGREVEEPTPVEEQVVTPAGASAGEMVLSTTGDPYQTVTIVPSETSQGEVSYVLIVQQQDGKDKSAEDLTVYDFDDHEENDDPTVGAISAADSQEVEDKSKIMKILPRKSQTVAQAHMCNYCNYTSHKRYLLSRHMKSHSEERPHKCSVCERGFKTLASLQNHVNTHTGTKPHECKFCPSAFTTSGELVRHVRYKHTHEKPHKCSICDYASVELSKMRNHMRCHTGERPYQCSHCTYASPDTFKLKRHLRTHTGEKPYECDICHVRFTQSNSLKAHKLIHSAGDKPVYQCELCPATCGRKTDLRVHVQKLHTSDKPLKCRRCGKQFPDRYTYKVHYKSHEGEKCYKCDLCPYASVSQRHLESHMLVHMDQKPYACELCDQAFRQRQLLKRHQNLYHNPNYVPPVPKEKTHECPECLRAFRHKGNLIRHMSAHDPESANEERALALKMGRQKKVQIIDGQQVEVMPASSNYIGSGGNASGGGGDSDCGEGMNNMVAVEAADGQQYVVLEVIQLEDGDGESQVTVIPAGSSHEHVLNRSNTSSTRISIPNLTSSSKEVTSAKSANVNKSPKTNDAVRTATIVKQEQSSDMDNCFGFDEEIEDEEADEEEEEEDVPKSNIQLLQSVATTSSALP